MVEPDETLRGTPLRERRGWESPPPTRGRIARAVRVPALAGISLFLAAIVVAIVVTMLQPRVPVEQVAPMSEASASEPQPQHTPDTEETDQAQRSEQKTVFVHVVGEVQQPGVVELASGARVEAAIAAAGGATPAAILSGVNLARIVVDGEQIVVPDAEHPVVDGSQPQTDPGKINLNTASAQQLDTLPRVGPALAQRIIDWREAHGGFASVEQLSEVSGIGAKTFEELRELVTI